MQSGSRVRLNTVPAWRHRVLTRVAWPTWSASESPTPTLRAPESPTPTLRRTRRPCRLLASLRSSRAMSSEQLLVDNAHQARKVRVLTAATVALAAAACVWALGASLSVAPDPAAFILAPLGVAAAWGLVFYGRRYVVTLRVAGDALALRTAFRARELRIPLERLGRRTLHEGELDLVDAPSVNAPWLTLRVDGYRVPFVVDLQAEHVDVQAIVRLQRGP
jgi:hypothetical protein